MREINAEELKAKIVEGCQDCPTNGTYYCRNSCEIDWVIDLINDMIGDNE